LPFNQWISLSRLFLGIFVHNREVIFQLKFSLAKKGCSPREAAFYFFGHSMFLKEEDDPLHNNP